MDSPLIHGDEWILNRIEQLINSTKSIHPNETVDREIPSFFFETSIFKPWLEVSLMCAYALIGVIGFTSNLLFIVALIATPKLLKQPANIRFLLLMISDLMMCVFCLPITLFSLIWKYWTLGSMACKLLPFTQSVCVMVCTMTTAMISVDRLLAVTGNAVSSRNSLLGSNKWLPLIVETVVIWGTAVLLSLPIPIHQELLHVSVHEAVLIKRCTEVWPKSTLQSMYIATNMVGLFVVPTLILVTTYCMVTRHLSSANTHRTTDNNNDSRPIVPQDSAINSSASTVTLTARILHSFCCQTSSQSSSNPNPVVVVAPPENSRSSGERNDRVSRILFWILVCHLVMWGPWNLFNLYLNRYPHTEKDAAAVHLILALLYLLSMTVIPLNAFFYGWINPSVRQEATRVLTYLSCDFQ